MSETRSDSARARRRMKMAFRSDVVAFSSDVIRLSRTDLDIKRIAARQCGKVLDSIIVAHDDSPDDRRYYYTDPHAISRPDTPCSDGDSNWSQLTPGHGMSGAERRRINRAIAETAAAGPVRVSTDDLTGVMVVASGG